MHKHFRNAAVAPLAALAFAGAAQAADSATVEELDQRIRILERQLELQKEDAETKAKDASTVSASDKGFSIRSAKGDYEIRFNALLQADARWYTRDVQDGAAPIDSFLFRRVEPTIQGSLGRFVGFRITPAFGDSSSFDTTDIYADLRFHPAATLRAGKFKQPFGLENLQSSAALSFIERGLPTGLVPSRDLGLQLGGELLDSRLSYGIGVFNGAPDGADAGRSDVDDQKELTARVFAEPFRSDPGFFQGLGVGLAYSIGDKSGSVTGKGGSLPQYKTPGQLNFFAYQAAAAATATAPAVVGVEANGEQTRYAPQAWFYRGNFGALAEYVSSEQAVQRGTNEADLRNDAWQLQLNYVLTAEDAGYKGVKPRIAFKPGAEGWGAFEVALRYGELDIDDEAFTGSSMARFANPTTQASKVAAAGLALNWYLTNNAKLALDYEHTRFDGGGGGSTAAPEDRKDEDVILARVQLAY